MIFLFGTLGFFSKELNEWFDKLAGKVQRTREEMELMGRATQIATERINKSISEDPNNIWNLNYGTGQAYEHAVTQEDRAQAERELAREKKLREDIAKVEEQERKKRESQK